MKKLILSLVALLGAVTLNAQELNDKGLYITSDGELFNGKITSVKEGVKCEMNIANGIVQGEAVYYFASGNKMETGTFTNGQKEGQWTRFTESGSVAAIAFYNLGKKHGTWLVYDEKGNKRFEMNYNNGEKTGIWTSWDESGLVMNTKNYEIRN